MKPYKLILNGKEVTSKEFHKDGPVGGGGIPMVTKTYTDANPMISESLGCLPNQIPEMRETLERHNIQGVEVTKTGALSITSRKGRGKLMRIKQQHDADGCYGD